MEELDKIINYYADLMFAFEEQAKKENNTEQKEKYNQTAKVLEKIVKKFHDLQKDMQELKKLLKE